jgi:hypothetical protein
VTPRMPPATGRDLEKLTEPAPNAYDLSRHKTMHAQTNLSPKRNGLPAFADKGERDF